VSSMFPRAPPTQRTCTWARLLMRSLLRLLRLPRLMRDINFDLFFASCFPNRPVSSSMPLNRLAFNRLAYSTSIRMASTIVGKSGRVYVQGEALQRHGKDHKLSVFKAEYVSNSMPFSQLCHISEPYHLGPEMSLSSSSAYLGRSTICPCASRPGLQAHVGFECTSIVTKRKAF
jgi:hypothetical protein